MNRDEAYRIWLKNYDEFTLAFSEYRSAVEKSTNQFANGNAVAGYNPSNQKLDRIKLLELEVLRLQKNMDDAIDSINEGE
jgi:hypothetical protein